MAPGEDLDTVDEEGARCRIGHICGVSLAGTAGEHVDDYDH